MPARGTGSAPTTIVFGSVAVYIAGRDTATTVASTSNATKLARTEPSALKTLHMTLASGIRADCEVCGG